MTVEQATTPKARPKKKGPGEEKRWKIDGKTEANSERRKAAARAGKSRKSQKERTNAFFLLFKWFFFYFFLSRIYKNIKNL